MRWWLSLVVFTAIMLMPLWPVFPLLILNY